MTAALQVSGLSWTPLGRRTPVLQDVELRIEPGERVLLVGPSGAGKSTLLRAAAGVLEANEPGELRGAVHVDGHPVGQGHGRVGLLLQDPRDARVAELAGRDVAFACENAAMPAALIPGAVESALAAVGFAYGPGRRTDALSGGEAQRLALAGVIASRPRLLLLDEPTSMLDPVTAQRVRDAVLGVPGESPAHDGVALVVAEHRLEGWVDVLPRMIVLDASGTVVADGDTHRILRERGDELAAQGIWVPGRPPPRPVDVPAHLLTPLSGRRREPGSRLMQAQDVGLRHRKALRFTGARRREEPATLALDGVDAAIDAERVLALRGASGSGKSSLLALLAGLLAPTRGTVEASPAFADGLGSAPDRWPSRGLAARIGWVPHDSGASVVGRTVRDDLLATARALSGAGGRHQESDVGADVEARLEELAQVLGLERLLRRNPQRLSGGESRRLAVAAGLLHGPPMMCLDEPTVGQDRLTWAAVAGVVQAARTAGAGLVVATHDEDLARLADDELWLAGGRVAGPARDGGTR